MPSVKAPGKISMRERRREGVMPNRDVFGVQHVDRPEWRANPVDALDQYVPAVRQADERRAQERSDLQVFGFGARGLPPQDIN